MKKYIFLFVIANLWNTSLTQAQTLIWDSIPVYAFWEGGTSQISLDHTNSCMNPIPLCEADVISNIDVSNEFNGACAGQEISVWYSFFVQDPLNYLIEIKTGTCDNYMPLYQRIYGPFDLNYSSCSQLGLVPVSSTIFQSTSVFVGSSSSTNTVPTSGYYLFELRLKLYGCNICDFIETRNLNCDYFNQSDEDLNETAYTWFDENSIELQNPNVGCDEYFSICEDTTLFFGFNYAAENTASICENSSQDMWYGFYISDPNDFDWTIMPVANAPQTWTVGISHLDVYGPLNPSFPCNGIECAKNQHIDLDSVTTTYSYNDVTSTISAPGYYLLNIVLVDDDPAVNLICQGYYGVVTQNLSCPPPTYDFVVDEGTGNLALSSECESCIPEMVPEAGKKYVISAWVLQEGTPFGTVSYAAPEIIVKYLGTSQQESVVCDQTHPIIDGWQLMEQTIEVPVGTTQIEIQLKSNGGNTYYDDIRFFPYDGSMKSYVYDPINLRFVAELDERHFATLYEYDEEGRLMRIKKETERGIMTIQESKSSNVKREGIAGDE